MHCGRGRQSITLSRCVRPLLYYSTNSFTCVQPRARLCLASLTHLLCAVLESSRKQATLCPTCTSSSLFIQRIKGLTAGIGLIRSPGHISSVIAPGESIMCRPARVEPCESWQSLLSNAKPYKRPSRCNKGPQIFVESLPVSEHPATLGRHAWQPRAVITVLDWGGQITEYLHHVCDACRLSEYSDTSCEDTFSSEEGYY